jgi:hypothetical protein
MHVIYKPERPEDGDRQEWDFNPGRVRASQAEMIEARFGGTWDEFRARLFQGSMKAQRVMLWHLFNLTHPGFRFEDVPDFYSDELVMSYSVAELTKLREAFEQASLPADAREAMLAAVDKEMTAAAEREGTSADPGKAPSETPLTDGGSPLQST